MHLAKVLLQVNPERSRILLQWPKRQNDGFCGLLLQTLCKTEEAESPTTKFEVNLCDVLALPEHGNSKTCRPITLINHRTLPWEQQQTTRSKRDQRVRRRRSKAITWLGQLRTSRQSRIRRQFVSPDSSRNIPGLLEGVYTINKLWLRAVGTGQKLVNQKWTMTTSGKCNFYLSLLFVLFLLLEIPKQLECWKMTLQCFVQTIRINMQLEQISLNFSKKVYYISINT